MKLDTNTIYRYSRPYSEIEKTIGGYHNYFHYTYSNGLKKPLLERGINPIGDKLPDGRVPAILINSNPLKSGTEDTPWMDVLDHDNGFIRYAGDNKPGSNNPDTSRNLLLIKQYEMHQSNKTLDRKLSSPIIVFENVQVDSKRKGYKKFLGFGIIKKVDRIIEFDSNTDTYYPNYVFDIMIMDISNEGDTFNWAWIFARRQNKLTLEQTHSLSPASWKIWVRRGIQFTTGLQRKVYKPLIVPVIEQKKIDKKSTKILDKVYHYYKSNKYGFEYLAAYVTEKTITNEGSNFSFGWITSKSGDGGVDYVGKIRIGKNLLSLVDIVVLGQAKCISPASSVSGVDLARTVSRLKRGWIGSFVTTGAYSSNAQKEVFNDKYPLMLINGKLVTDILIKAMHDEKMNSVSKFLKKLDSQYSKKVINRRPEEILFS